MEREKINFNIEGSESSTEHTFFLRRLSSGPTSPFVEVDFSPVLKPSSTEPQPQNPSHSHPIFNLDSCYFTPAFILQTDREKYRSSQLAYANLHQQKKTQLCEQKSQLYVAKPSKSNSYCCICKMTFEDYLTHVTFPKHQELMRKSEFTESIGELCHRFWKDDVDKKKEVNTKRGKKIEKSEKGSNRRNKQKNIILLSSSTTIEQSPIIRREVHV